MKYKYLVELINNQGQKQIIIETDKDTLNKDKVREFLINKYDSKIAILSLELVTNTNLKSGVYQ